MSTRPNAPAAQARSGNVSLAGMAAAASLLLLLGCGNSRGGAGTIDGGGSGGNRDAGAGGAGGSCSSASFDYCVSGPLACCGDAGESPKCVSGRWQCDPGDVLRSQCTGFYLESATCRGAGAGGSGTGGSGAGGSGAGGGGAGGATDTGGHGLGGGAGGGKGGAGGAAGHGGQGSGGASGADGEGAVCPATPTSNGAPTASATCSGAPVAVNPVTFCGSAATASNCPVRAQYALHCAGSGYGPWVAPRGANGASVMFVTNTGSFVTRLFSVDPAAVAAVDLPGLTAATEALVVDRAGQRVIFGGEMPGVWRLTEASTGWMRDEASVGPMADLAMLSDGRAIDDTHAFAAYFQLSDYLPRLLTRDGSCWHATRLAPTRVVSMGMDVDAMNRPWVAWLTNATSGAVTLGLAAPDGTVSNPWTGMMSGDYLSFWDRPVVLAGGLAGTGTDPALATQRVDGLHVITPSPTGGVWIDHLVGGARATQTTDCPATNTVPQGTPPCQGLTSCTRHSVGALAGYGLARTASGKAYASWIEVDTTTTYSLSSSGAPTCPGVTTEAGPPSTGPGCICSAVPTTAVGTATLVVAHVTEPGSVPQGTIVRFPLDGNGVPAQFSVPGIGLATRGNTLLVVASVGSGPDTELQLLEIDSAGVP